MNWPKLLELNKEQKVQVCPSAIAQDKLATGAE